MRHRTATTLADVARKAGVSTMTASVVLNGARSSARVSDTTRARVLEAAALLRYRPNAAARGLQRRRMNTIGVVAVVDGGELNLYFLEILNGILEAARAHAQNTTVFSISNWVDDEARVEEFCDGRVDGIILIAPSRIPLCFQDPNHQHTPFVAIHTDQPLPGAVNLDIDNAGGARMMVQHLIENGHRRILHLTGGESRAARERIAGYRLALEAAGIPADERLIAPAGFSQYNGRTTMARLLDERALSPLPTAIFAASDAIAAGAIDTLAERGWRVPQQISVAGFDDSLDARMTTPPLTTVRQPFRSMGRRAAEVVLGMIHGHERFDGEPIEARGTGAGAAAGPGGDELFPVELVIRQSVCRPEPAQD